MTPYSGVKTFDCDFTSKCFVTFLCLRFYGLTFRARAAKRQAMFSAGGVWVWHPHLIWKSRSTSTSYPGSYLRSPPGYNWTTWLVEKHSPRIFCSHFPVPTWEMCPVENGLKLRSQTNAVKRQTHQTLCCWFYTLIFINLNIALMHYLTQVTTYLY
jgi:hypothetical protein